jgi:outer membrane protein insertion porin family
MMPTQFDTVEGDPFNPREIRAAAERIRALDFFDNVEVESREGTGPDQAVIDVDVEEKPTGALSFGATYSLSYGVGFNARISERNFLGRGQTLVFGINTATGSQSLEFSFVEPNFRGRDVALRFDAFYQRTTFATNEFYNSQIISVRPGLEFPVGEDSRLGLSLVGLNSQVTNVAAASSQILRAEAAQGTETAIGVGYQYSFDNRASGLNPDAGVLFRFGQDIAGLQGMNYIKSEALMVAETKFRNSDVTLRAIFEGGAINSLGNSNSKITERFFLDSNKLRGFDARGVGPRDLNVGNRDALGGNFYAVARFEADFPLPLPDEYGISGGAFLDVGSLWGLDNTRGGPAGANPVDATAHLRASLGVSIFWETVLGPLRFNFSTPLARQPYDNVRNFDLTVTTRF